MMKYYNWLEVKDKLAVQGRTWEHEENLQFNWSGSGFTITFTGTVLLANLVAQSGNEFDGVPGSQNAKQRTVWPWVSVFVDGNEEPSRTFEINNTTTSYLLYAGKENAPHTIRLVKLTENFKTGLSLHGLSTDGEILKQQKGTGKKKIEFVGDSITCGFGLGTEEKDRYYYPQEENVWMAHGPTAARILGMDWQMLCVSGICLARRKEIPLPISMDMLYEYTDWIAQKALGQETDKWNFKENETDYVVVNLGTNDSTAASFSNNPDEIEVQYAKDYIRFLKKIRSCNGEKTKIICAMGSMDYYFYDTMVKAVTDYCAETGDNQVYCFKYCRMSPMDPMGACGHPGQVTQQKMARELAAFIFELEKETHE